MPFQPLVRRYPRYIMHFITCVYLLAITTILWFALSMGQNVHEARFGRGTALQQGHGPFRSGTRTTGYQSPHTQSEAWTALDASLSTSITATPSTAVSGLSSISTASHNSIISSEINVRFATSAKLSHNTTKATPSSTIPNTTRRGMPAPKKRQVEIPTSTTATTPPASKDEKQNTVSRKWKMVALTLAAILGAILVVGLIIFLGCGWLVLDLLDRSDKR